MLTKAQVKGNKSSFCSIGFTVTPGAAFERVVVRSEPPTGVGNAAQVAKSGQCREHTPHSEKGRAIRTTPRAAASPGVDGLWSAAADADGRMQRAAPVEAQDGHFHLKGGVRVVFGCFFLIC